MPLTENKKRTIQFYAFLCVILLILLVAGIMMLKYQVEGEKNMPFTLETVTVISTVEGMKKDEEKNSENRWALDIVQNNDLYLSFEKNEHYKKQDLMDKIIIDNFTISQMPKKGTIRKYMPNSTEGRTFKNTQDYEMDFKLEYQGAKKDSLKDLTIGNQGGMVAFRYTISNIAEYFSDEEEIVHDGSLLTKAKVKLEDITCKVGFDVTIKVLNKAYKTTITLNLPNQDVITESTSKQELDTKSLRFKRVQL